MAAKDQGGPPIFFTLTGHLDRTRLLELLAQKLDRDLEAIAASPESRIAGLGYRDPEDTFGVDFFTYVRAAVGSGTTEAEQAFVSEFREEFRQYVERRARSGGRDFAGKEAPVGKPGILDRNTYGVRHQP